MLFHRSRPNSGCRPPRPFLSPIALLSADSSAPYLSRLHLENQIDRTGGAIPSDDDAMILGVSSQLFPETGLTPATDLVDVARHGRDPHAAHHHLDGA